MGIFGGGNSSSASYDQRVDASGNSGAVVSHSAGATVTVTDHGAVAAGNRTAMAALEGTFDLVGELGEQNENNFDRLLDSQDRNLELGYELGADLFQGQLESRDNFLVETLDFLDDRSKENVGLASDALENSAQSNMSLGRSLSDFGAQLADASRSETKDLIKKAAPVVYIAVGGYLSYKFLELFTGKGK